MKAKKIMTFIMITAIGVSSLMGCGNSNGGGTTVQTSQAEEGQQEAETGEKGTDSGSVLATADTNGELSQTDNVDPGTLNVAINSTVTSLGPFVAAQNGYNFVRNYVYETLGEFAFGGEVFQGIIAKSWEMTDGEGYEYDIIIYDNVTDSKNNHITAEDVAWAYNTVLEKGTNPLVSAGTVESVEAVDETTIHVVLKECTVGAIESFMKGASIVSRKEYEASSDEMATTPVGTGRYVVKDFKSDSSISFEKRDSYWQTDESLVADVSRANVSRINIQEITETSQMATALQTDSVDVAVGINAISTQMFTGDSNYNVYSTPSKLGMQLYFSGDGHSPVADNKELRQAIAYAINMDAVIASVYNGYGARQYVLGPDSVPDFLEKWRDEDYYGFDVEKAKELLKEAGYSEGELTLSLLTVSDDTFVKYAEIIQSCLMAAGINVEINAYEGALYMSSFMDSSQYDLMLNNVTGNYITQLWSGKLGQQFYNGVTISGFKDDELQKLLDTCSSVEGHTEENIDACWQYIKETVYVYSMGAPEAFTVANAKVKIGNPMYDGLSNLSISGTIYTE